jgi:hypothetical protein
MIRSLYLDGLAPPLVPAVGMRLIHLKFDDIVDVVINNRPTPDFGSGISGQRTSQHPMHLHGHKFWVSVMA